MADNYFAQFHAANDMPSIQVKPGDPNARPKSTADLEATRLLNEQRRLDIAERKRKLEMEQSPVTPGNVNLTGEDYLSTIPRELAGQVKALADGRRAFPTGSALRSPQVQQLIAAATQYDPTLDAANAATRVATRKKFTSGTTRDNITAINTALGHLGSLKRDADALHNGSFTPFNAIGNAAIRTFGDPRPTNFNINRQAVADELERAFRGAGGSQAGIDEWKSNINNAQSPEQLNGAISKGVELLGSRLDALNSAYTEGMGKSADPMSFLNPHAQKVFQALGPGGDGEIPPDDPNGGGGQPPILSSGGPAQALATGPMRNEYDSKTSSMVDHAIKRGTPIDQLRQQLPPEFRGQLNTGQYLAAQAYAKAHPGYSKSLAEVTRPVANSNMNRFMASPIGTGLTQAANGFSGGMLDEIGGGVASLVNGRPLAENIAHADANKQAQSDLNPGSSLLGNVAGGIGAMVAGGGLLKGAGAMAEGGWLAANPIKAAMLGDAAYGGAYGAGENNDNRLGGAGIGALAGAGGSLAGQGATMLGGKMLRGVMDPAVNRLRDAGIPLTAGEALGGAYKKFQDASTSIFGPGNMMANRLMEGRQKLNQVAFDTAGQVVGQPINSVGSHALGQLDNAKGAAYGRALDPVSINANDPAFIGDIQGALGAAKGLPSSASGDARDALAYHIGDNIDRTNDSMSGRNFQEAYRGLARAPGERGNAPYAHEFANIATQGKDALAGALERQNPGAYKGFLDANSANRHLNILADALDKAKNQVHDGNVLFTPAQLNNASAANAKKYTGKVSAALGDRPFASLAQDAQQVMSSKVPDSGTPTRLAAATLLGAVGGGGGYTANGGEGAGIGAAGALGFASLFNTKVGQKLLVDILMKRPEALRRIGSSAVVNPSLGGDILAAPAVNYLAGR